jgi:hypothetical protein
MSKFLTHAANLAWVFALVALETQMLPSRAYALTTLVVLMILASLQTSIYWCTRLQGSKVVSKDTFDGIISKLRMLTPYLILPTPTSDWSERIAKYLAPKESQVLSEKMILKLLVSTHPYSTLLLVLAVTMLVGLTVRKFPSFLGFAESIVLLRVAIFCVLGSLFVSSLSLILTNLFARGKQ